jgi:hypothetical protein
MIGSLYLADKALRFWLNEEKETLVLPAQLVPAILYNKVIIMHIYNGNIFADKYLET